jgi:hypothetical protein
MANLSYSTLYSRDYIVTHSCCLAPHHADAVYIDWLSIILLSAMVIWLTICWRLREVHIHRYTSKNVLVLWLPITPSHLTSSSIIIWPFISLPWLLGCQQATLAGCRLVVVAVLKKCLCYDAYWENGIKKVKCAVKNETKVGAHNYKVLYFTYNKISW